MTEQYQSGDDGSVAVTLETRVDRGILSPEQFEKLRELALSLQEEPMLILRFDNLGMTALETGEIREAITRFRELRELHPDEALHAIQLSQAVLTAGFGVEARRMAAEAVAAEPDSAAAHHQLGWVLQHDELGRRFGPGFDRAAAIAAHRQAVDLEPDEPVYRLDLAILLEHDEQGRRYVSTSLDEAITEYRQLLTVMEPEAVAANLLAALLWAEDFDGLAEVSQTLGTGDVPRTYRTLAIAARDGAEAGLAEAVRLFPQLSSRREALQQVGGSLIRARRYAAGAALIEEASRGAADAAALRSQAEFAHRLTRYESMELDPDDPATAVKELYRQLFLVGRWTAETFEPVVAPEVLKTLTDQEALEAWATLQGRFRSQREFDPGLIVDGTWSLLDYRIEGQKESGWRVQVQGALPSATVDESFFVVPTKQGPRLLSSGRSLEPIGHHVLELIDAGLEGAAAQWLDWARELAPQGSEDPLSQPPILSLWKRGSQSHDRRLAAASLMGSRPWSAAARPILEAALKDPADETPVLPVQVALARVLDAEEDNRALLALATEVLEDVPDSDLALLLLVQSHGRLDDWGTLEVLLDRRLEERPDDVAALRFRALVATAQEDYTSTRSLYERIMETGQATSEDYNNMAWNDLFLEVDDDSLDLAQRAVRMSQRQAPHSLHTLATVQVELGRAFEARQVLLESLELGDGEPGSADWYVLGRLAESYGLTETARQAYGRVVADEPVEGGSVRILADRRLGLLDASGNRVLKTEP